MSEAPDELTELTEAVPPPASRRRRRWALWGALAVVALGAGAVAVAGPDGGDPPKLPLALGAGTTEGGAAAAPMAADMSLAWVRYVAGDDLPALGGSGPAYRLRGPDEAAVRRLAAAFGLGRARMDHHDDLWDVTGPAGPDDAVPQLQVFADGTWSYFEAPIAMPGAVGGGASGSTGSVGATEPAILPEEGATCPPDAKCVDPVPLTTVVPTPPADLPSRDEAEAIALERFRSAGMDVDGATVTVDGPYDGWYVTVEPALDGLPVSGVGWSATVGSKGRVLGASGTIGQAERLGTYPTIDTRAAVDRLNDGTAWGSGVGYGARDAMATTDAVADVGSAPVTTVPEDGVTETTSVAVDPSAPVAGCPEPADATATDCVQIDPMPVDPMPVEPMPTEPPEPTEVVLHGAERILVVLMASDGSTDRYAVPGYRMTGDDGAVVEVPSVDDDSLLPTTTVAPPDDSTTTGGGPAIVNPTPAAPPTTPIPPVGEAGKPSR
jgi:hypothetical protein